MMYTVKVKWYNEFSKAENKMDTNFCFVAAESYHEVIDIMEQYYGKNDIEEITMSVFSPDNFLEFDSDVADMFYDVKATLGAKVIW